MTFPHPHGILSGMSDKIVSGLSYLALPSSPDTWLIDPLLPSGGALLLYGDPKIGKSFAALQLAEAVQTGKDWLGFKVRKGKVVYIQLDTPRNVWQDRINQLYLKGAITDLSFKMADRESLNTWPFNILNPDHLIMLREELQAINADLVIIDTLRESHQADENDSTEMQGAIASLVAATRPAALCLISHSRKPSQDSELNLMADNRGSGYVVGAVDAIARFTNKSVRVGGRSIEEHTISVEREDSGFWSVTTAETDMHCLRLLIDPSLTSLRAASKVLGELLGKPPEACRGMLRSYLKSHPDLQSHLR